MYTNNILQLPSNSIGILYLSCMNLIRSFPTVRYILRSIVLYIYYYIYIVQ